MKGIDTGLYRLDKPALKLIWENTTNPEVMKHFLTEWPLALALKRISLLEYEAGWRDHECILWQPADQSLRHVEVYLAGKQGRHLVHVHRAVWAATRQVTQAQGDPLRGDEQIHHSCSHRGKAHSAFGVCLNPKCLWRGEPGSHTAVRTINATLKRIAARQRGAVGTAVAV